MKIIDCRIVSEDSTGTTVKFMLGQDDICEYRGDDWNDVPYEHNAGTVYDRFAVETTTVTFPPHLLVLEPADDWIFDGNSPYSKIDMREELVPCLIVLDPGANRDFYEGSFTRALGAKDCERYYFNDPMQPQ